MQLNYVIFIIKNIKIGIEIIIKIVFYKKFTNKL